MALLFEIAGYSLHQLILGPEEKVYTSMARSWGAPSANPTAKEWIMDITIRKNPNSMNSITFTLYNLRMSGNDTDNSFTTCPDVLKQHFTSKNNLTGIVSANSPQRNCSVHNETYYGNFEIGSTLGNQLCVIDGTFEFLVDLEPADDSSPIISDGEIISPKIPA